ncbi:multidrug resistance protein [Bradyrhizobium japonicum]
MNKFDRQSSSADIQALPDDIAEELSRLPSEVLSVDDAPSLAPPAPLSQDEVRTIVISLMLTMFLAALDQTIVATALPTIGRQFHDVSNLSWVITAYLLASTAVAPVFGTLSDIYGRRVMIIISLSLFVAGSVLCAIAPSMPMLILARGLQGLGGGGIMPVVQTVISDVVSPRERGQYQAYFSSVWMVGGILGPVIGGVFAEHLHWSMIFWINLPLAAAAIAMLLPKMKKIPVFHRKRKVDWLGGVLLMASAVVFMLVLTWGGTRYPWLSPTVLAMVGGAVALAVTFVWHARRADEPFLPLKLLTGSVAPFALTAGGCGLGAITGLTVQLPLYYESVYHLSASEAGPCADPARGGLDLWCCDRRPHHGARQALQARRHRRHVMGRALRARSHGHHVAAVGSADADGGVRARPRHDLPGLRGLAAEFGRAPASRHHHRRDELLPLADVLVHGRSLRRDPADRARRRHSARRRAPCRRQHPRDSRRGYEARVSLRLRCRHRADDHRLALPDHDGGAAARRPLRHAAGGDGGVGVSRRDRDRRRLHLRSSSALSPPAVP